MAQDRILDVRNVKKYFGEGHAQVRALQGVDLYACKREVVLIMGPSGSGKTTLLSISGGILKPTEGDVLVNGKSIIKMTERELVEVRLRHIGFVFQSFMLLEALTAEENIQVVAEIAGTPSKEAHDKAEAILTKLGLGERRHDIIPNLSGGEKQRVSIARALINGPELILADEPTANLDSKMGHEVVQILHEIADKNDKAVVIVSHDERIKDVADRILLLEDGKFKEIPSHHHSK